MMRGPHFDVQDKFVLVAGGSKGLGRELSLELVGRGAHVTVIARPSEPLKKIKLDMEALKTHRQHIAIKSLDLIASQEVFKFVNSLEKHIYALFCVAGGTDEEIGNFTQISTDSIRGCMEKNYLSAAYIANAVMKRWVSKLPSANTRAESTANESHHIVFTASTAALVAVPGYAAYSPAKAAIRALADNLRQESLIYSPHISVQIHCCFPGTIYTESFYREQAKKPDLCKKIEGTVDDGGGLTPNEVAKRILTGLDQGNKYITVDTQTRLLLNNMRGPSPRDSPVLDWCMGFVASLVWPLVQGYLDHMIANSSS